MTPDHINGAFELFGATLLLLDVLALRRDRIIAGVHWGPRIFFTAWGFWNLYYYPQLNQYWSFIGGCALAIVNAAWLVLLVKCEHRALVEKQSREIMERSRRFRFHPTSEHFDG